MADKKTKPKSGVWTAEEKAAMREAARERKAAQGREAGEKDLLAKVAEMPEPDKSMAERIHAIVTEAAPELMPKTWYGMPAYARDGKIVCFFTPASKFKERYSTFGFQPEASLDEGTMWPTSFALKELTAADEKRISALVKKAIG